MHEWTFETTNVMELLNEVSAAKDCNDFRLDISTMNWDEYIKHYMLGIRKYVLKDDISTFRSARKQITKYFFLILMITK